MNALSSPLDRAFFCGLTTARRKIRQPAASHPSLTGQAPLQPQQRRCPTLPVPCLRRLSKRHVSSGARIRSSSRRCSLLLCAASSRTKRLSPALLRHGLRRRRSSSISCSINHKMFRHVPASVLFSLPESRNASLFFTVPTGKFPARHSTLSHHATPHSPPVSGKNAPSRHRAEGGVPAAHAEIPHLAKHFRALGLVFDFIKQK